MAKLRKLAERALSGFGAGSLANQIETAPVARPSMEPAPEARTVIVPAPSSGPTLVTSTGQGGGGRLFQTSIALGIVAPFLLACAYFGMIATPQFEAEARFAVRSLEAQDASMGNSASGGNGGSRMLATTPLSQDAYVINSYVHSPAIIDAILAELDLRAMFGGEKIDWWSRLPQDATREDLLDYWTSQVTTYLDGPSGIVTLQVRAFTPEDAKTLASSIIAQSELLANDLSRRARDDYVKRAEQITAAREADYKLTLEQLNTLQNETTVLDPASRATETGTLLTTLLARKIDVDARLFVLTRQSVTNSPAVRQLERTQAALESQIQDLRSQIADSGTANTNLSETFRRFAELETERSLAAQMYSAARRNFAQAQIDAIRKAVYVTTFVRPELPEDSRYPRRIATPLLILLGLSVAWGIVALLIASVEDHRT